jgi:DegV family protein with EDD domain
MAKVALVTDSTAYLPVDLIKKYNITVTPQVIIWGEDTYRDGVDMLPQEFYKRLENTRVMPTTSQVSIIDMKSTFECLVEQGFDVLGVFLSAKLSGTMGSADQALKMLPSMAEKISILDSNSTAMAMGFHVLAAAKAAIAGESLLECRKVAEEAQNHTGVFFTVDTLDFLHRGGRIGGAAALMGTMLNIKPVLELRDGRIEPIEKVRTKTKATERMLELMVEKIANRMPVRLATLHANAESEARDLLHKASAQLNPIEEVFAAVSPAIGTHAGPGTVGLAFMAGM